MEQHRLRGTLKTSRDPKKGRLTDCGLTERTDTDVQKYKRECMRDRHAEERNGWQNSKMTRHGMRRA